MYPLHTFESSHLMRNFDFHHVHVRRSHSGSSAATTELATRTAELDIHCPALRECPAAEFDSHRESWRDSSVSRGNRLPRASWILI
jgi:hypothetical protein